MNYQITQPPTILSKYVRYFWTLDLDPSDDCPQTLNILADRYPRLIIQQSTIRDGNEQLLCPHPS